MTQASILKTYGDYSIPLDLSQEYLTIHFSPTSGPRQKRWRNYGLSADFLGDYFATFFPGENTLDSHHNTQDTVKAAVSFIANELLENAIKYSETSGQYPVSISLYLNADQIIFQVINVANRATAQTYEAFVKKVIETDDMEALYMEQLEKTAMGEGESSMGIVTMLNDYQAHFGWQFSQPKQNADADVELVRVEVVARLDIRADVL